MAREDSILVEQYAAIHKSRRYGDSSIKNLRFLRPDVRLLAPRSIIDYGCGQSGLLDALDPTGKTRLVRYDPAIPEYSTPPAEPADLLLNIDVLEHVPERDLDDVVGHMKSLCRNAIVIVDTRPAALILPDGRNAHCTLKPHTWWQAYLGRFFPTLVPIRVARRSRAGFRTWRHSPGDAARFRGMRVAEDVRHYADRARRLFGGKAH